MDLTIKDIAKLAGVSPTAVSFVLNEKAKGNVSPQKQQHIADIIQQHGYTQNRTAKALIMRRTYRIAICYSGSLEDRAWFGNASHHILINSIASRLHEMDYGVDLIAASPQASLNALSKKLLSHKADGFLFINYEAGALEKIAFMLAHNKAPVISVGTVISSGDTEWVAVDRESSFERIVLFALEKGISRLGFLDTDISKTYSLIKQRVFERVMRGKGLSASAVGIVDVFNIKAIAETVENFIAKYPGLEGIVITDNGLAPYVQLILSGRPIEIFGFGDDIFVSMCAPPIAYMRLPMDKLAQMAVAHLLRKIEHAPDIAPLKALLPCDFVKPR